MPPAEGRNPIPVIEARVLAGAGLAAAVAGAGAAAGGGEATIDTVGIEARARSTSSREAPPSARATRRSGGGFAAGAGGRAAGGGGVVGGGRCAGDGGGGCPAGLGTVMAARCWRWRAGGVVAVTWGLATAAAGMA